MSTLNEMLTDMAFEQLQQTELYAEIEKAINTYEKVQITLYNVVTTGDESNLMKIRCGIELTQAILRKAITGKTPMNYSKKDWIEIADCVADNAINVDSQDYTKKIFISYADYIDESINTVKPFVSKDSINRISNLSNEIREKTDLLDSGELKEVDYIEDCLWICLDAMIKLLAAYSSKNVGAEFGNLIDGLSTFAFEYGRLMLYKKENEIVDGYLLNQKKLDYVLEEQYKEYLTELQKQIDIFNSLVSNAYSDDFRSSLKGSVSLAAELGVKPEDVLDSVEKIDDFFM